MCIRDSVSHRLCVTLPQSYARTLRLAPRELRVADNALDPTHRVDAVEHRVLVGRRRVVRAGRAEHAGEEEARLAAAALHHLVE
eukprot:14956039-Alexandrium_andersonii.AAC.1